MTSRAQLYQYKGNRCASCGISVADMVTRYGTFNRMFEFHHVNRDTKDGHYKRLMTQRLSRRQIAEIDKCVLLCRQCHGIIHAQEITCTLELSVEFYGRTVKQRLNGWAKFDAVRKEFTIISNQPYLLELCQVRVGSKKPIYLFLIEIESEINHQRWLYDIAKYQNVEIVSLSSRHRFMTIKHVEGNKVSVVQSLGFPITTMEFHPTDQPDEKIFFQNGMILTTSGDFQSSGHISFVGTLLSHSVLETDAKLPKSAASSR